MSLLPIATPRTNDVLNRLRLTRQLNHDNFVLEGLYNQLSTGRRVNSLSDDPAAAISAVSLQASQEYSTQLVRNSQSAEGYLNVTDSTSASINNALIESKGIVVSAAQAPLGESERTAYAEELGRVIDRIITAGNVSYRGHYVLGGAIDDGAPLEHVGEAIVWSGQPATQSTRISRDWVLETGINAAEAIGVGGLIASSGDLDAAITRSTALSDLFDGAGLEPGVLRLGGGFDRIDVDLRAARTIGDLEDALEAVSIDGRSLSVTVGTDTFSIDFADGLGGILSIDDVGEGRTAEHLSIRNPEGFTGLPLITRDLKPATTAHVRLVDLAGGAGMDVSAGLKIEQGEHTYTVDLSTAETVEDIVIAINLSDADVRASINDNTGQIEIQGLASGVDYAITENGGNAASILGIRTSSEATFLSHLNRGLGINTTDGADLIIARTDGSELEIDIDGNTTIGDVIANINSHPDNIGPAAVVASIRSDSNGILLSADVGAQPMTIRQPAGSQAGEALGLIAAGTDLATSIDESGTAVIRGEDFAPVEPGGALDTLIRLQAAVEAGNIPEITRLAPRLDQHLSQSTLMRSDVGSRVQNLETVRQQTEDFSIEVDSQLSNQIDADFAEVISQLTARQTSMEASLRVIAQISQMTVLNFL